MSSRNCSDPRPPLTRQRTGVRAAAPAQHLLAASVLTGSAVGRVLSGGPEDLRENLRHLCCWFRIPRGAGWSSARATCPSPQRSRTARFARSDRSAGIDRAENLLPYAAGGHGGLVAASLQVRERRRRRRVAAQPLAVRAKPVSTARVGLARSGGRPGSWAKRRDARLWCENQGRDLDHDRRPASLLAQVRPLPSSGWFSFLRRWF